MKIFITHLDNAVSKETIESLKRDVTYFIVKHPEVLETKFNSDLNLTRDHLKPERLSFGVALEVMPNELKKRKTTSQEKQQQVFKDLVGFLEQNKNLYEKKHWY